MIRLILAIAILIVMLVFFATRVRVPAASSGLASMTLPDGSHVTAEVMDTPTARAQGLSGRDRLEEGKGMLFLFDTKAAHGFWMKGMKFSIDIVWLDGDKVVTVLPDVPFDRMHQLVIRMPTAPADKVLELPAGYAKSHGIVEGATLDILLPAR
ncbi:DUF192 domain-containing protein [Patescibacteria group bacterium]|nr:MAG: DUF192 domain-containing protein [Patescibacteria group bacterium]